MTVSASLDHTIGINLLSQLYRLAFGTILRVGVSQAAQGDQFFSFVDHALMVPSLVRETTAQSIAAVEWADAIVNGVRTLQQQTADRAPHVLP